MAKDKLKTVYICSACGEVHYRWQGQCNACKEWNTLVEDVINEEKKSSAKQTLTGAVKSMEFSDLSVISADNDKNRIKTGIDELDRVLGGGIVKGAGILIGGAPGAGKSTLLLQVCGNLCEKYNILYSKGKINVIDTMEYSKRNVTLKENSEGFNLELKYFLVDNLFNNFVNSNSFLRDLYDSKDAKRGHA